MTYRVAFSKRFQSDGAESALDPTAELDLYLADGVVADKVFVERFEPEAKHSQEVLDEDDAFLGLSAAEVWDYEVLDERRQEFEDAIQNSETVMEFNIVDETTADESDLSSGVPLGDGSTRVDPMTNNDGDEVTRSGSGVRSGIDDGPGGQPTGDPSAGETTPDRPYLGVSESDGIQSDAGGLDDLTIVSADDPNLGLTNYEGSGPDDWAADTGPSRVADRGIASADMSDDESTLAPDRSGDKDDEK
jgi:hypothetical protein